jgi:hypothetical protein
MQRRMLFWLLAPLLLFALIFLARALVRYIYYYFAVNRDRSGRHLWNGDGCPSLVLMFNEDGVLDGIDLNVVDIGLTTQSNMGDPPFWRQLPDPTTGPSSPLH